jgi:hypothetical protein
LLYIKGTVVVVSVCVSSALPVLCGASPDVTSLYVTSREKRNQGQFDFFKQKIW